MWLADGTGRSTDYVMSQMAEAFPHDMIMENGELLVKTDLTTPDTCSRVPHVSPKYGNHREPVVARRFDFSKNGFDGFSRETHLEGRTPTIDPYQPDWKLPRISHITHPPAVRLRRHADDTYGIPRGTFGSPQNTREHAPQAPPQQKNLGPNYGWGEASTPGSHVTFTPGESGNVMYGKPRRNDPHRGPLENTLLHELSQTQAPRPGAILTLNLTEGTEPKCHNHYTTAHGAR